MIISVVSLFPDLYKPFLNTSIIGRAQEQEIVTVDLQNLFDFSEPKKRIDSPTFGHGSGMLIRPEIVEKAIIAQEGARGKAYKIFFSPQGRKLDQRLLKNLAEILQDKQHIMLLPARYEGMDARVEEHYADCTISLGDFVLMGGDLPAMVLIEGMLRYIPGVIGKSQSVESDSFSGAFVDYPEYTEPLEWNGMKVPDVIRSGNHKELEIWRKNKAAEKTVYCHFQWLRSHVEHKSDKALALSYIPAHYAFLMHTGVIINKQGSEGNSSVTTLDIHDIARSAATYGIKKYFIITPLKDQQKMVQELLTFWQTEVGQAYNSDRYQALSAVQLVSSLDEALEFIEKQEGKKPLIIATAAHNQKDKKGLSYNDQAKVWSYKQPVALMFGTARGLSSSLINRSDFILDPIEGFTDFNHLSVRSAAAIIFDRWLGVNKKSN